MISQSDFTCFSSVNGRFKHVHHTGEKRQSGPPAKATINQTSRPNGRHREFPWPPTLSSLTVSDQDLTATDTARSAEASASTALIRSDFGRARLPGRRQRGGSNNRSPLTRWQHRSTGALRRPVDSACEFTGRSRGENCRTRLVAHDRGGAGDRDARGVGSAVDGPSDAVACFAGGLAVSRHRYDGRLLGVRTRTTGRCGSRVTLRDLSVYDLDPRDVGEFDLIVMGYVLQMLRDPLRALEAIRRVCRGHLVVLDTISLPLELPRTPLARLDARRDGSEWFVFNRRGLRKSLELAGWMVETTTPVLRDRPGPAVGSRELLAHRTKAALGIRGRSAAVRARPLGTSA